MCCSNIYAQEQFSSPQRLNGELVVNGDVLQNGFQISPDEKYVVYIADQNINDVFELFVAPIDGGAAVRLNGNLVSGLDVFNFQISLDSQRVLFLVGDNIVDGGATLFSVPISGGDVVSLSDDISGAANVAQYEISSDSNHVVYRVTTGPVFGDGVTELYSVSILGGPKVRLNSDLVAGGNVVGFLISLDGK